MRTSVSQTLDMSVLSWKEKSPDAIAELREHVDRDFEYVGYQF
jgi:ribosomal protein L31E